MKTLQVYTKIIPKKNYFYLYVEKYFSEKIKNKYKFIIICKNIL